MPYEWANSKKNKILGLVPKIFNEEFNKCEIYVEAKYAKKPFK